MHETELDWFSFIRAIVRVCAEFCEDISFTSGACDQAVEAWWLFTKNVKNKVYFAMLGEMFWSIKQRWKIYGDADFYFLFSCYTVSCSGSHKLWAVTCIRGLSLPGHVKYKNGYFQLLFHIQHV